MMKSGTFGWKAQILYNFYYLLRVVVYYRFIARLPIGLYFLFITLFLHFFLSWASYRVGLPLHNILSPLFPVMDGHLTSSCHGHLIGLDFLSITFFLHFFLSWTSYFFLSWTSYFFLSWASYRVGLPLHNIL